MEDENNFKAFLESFKGKGQDGVVESIQKGFDVCFEGTDVLDPETDYEEDEAGRNLFVSLLKSKGFPESRIPSLLEGFAKMHHVLAYLDRGNLQKFKDIGFNKLMDLFVQSNYGLAEFNMEGGVSSEDVIDV